MTRRPEPMSGRLRVACIQNCATTDPVATLTATEALVRSASAEGAELVALPEAFDYLAPTAAKIHAYAKPASDHLALRHMRTLAAELELWILLGSVSMRAEDGAPVNRSLLVDPAGNVRAYYDKVHLFDVDLPNDDPIRESDFYRAGKRRVVAHTPWGLMGMSICYDMRFPYLYRGFAQAGAAIIAIPAAFSSFTGPLHWEPLLRARAIETGCYVIAPAQCGDNFPGRRSHGHSLIIDPWGRVLADAGDQPGVIVADLDLQEVPAFRASIPSMTFDRTPLEELIL